jgi:hypothetical protein
MPMWTVAIAGAEDEQVEAWALATEGGALVALSEEGLLVRAWAPGQWCTVRHLPGTEECLPEPDLGVNNVLVGLPSR